MDYYKKYLKYKDKYLLLKNQYEQTGGDEPLVNIIKGINLFVDPDMEQFLNPIYGLVMCETGYITNNFYLHQSKFISTKESDIIYRISREIPGSIQPNIHIMKYKPIHIGKYIGLLYVHKNGGIGKMTKLKEQMIGSKKKFAKGSEELIKLNNSINQIQEHIDLLNSFSLKSLFKIEPGTDVKLHFHILLYCLWWIADNKDGIKEYYYGINDVFNIVKNYDNRFPTVIIPDNFTTEKFEKYNIGETPSFEMILYKILGSNTFINFNQEYSKNFCTVDSTYPDCGETTARNLLNLLSENGNRFNIDILSKLGAIPQVIEYYEKFNNFNSQSSVEPVQIYDELLNARDAWSKLIINWGNKNIRFLKECSDLSHRFEIDAGMSLDGSKANFLQLKNLRNII